METNIKEDNLEKNDLLVEELIDEISENMNNAIYKFQYRKD